MNKSTEDLKVRFIEEYSKNGFSKTKAAISIGIDRTTSYLWAKNDKEFAEKVNEARLSWIDQVNEEAERSIRALINGIPKIKDGKIIGWDTPPYYPALKDHLNRFGKKLGYGEETIRLDHTTNGKDINSNPLIFISADKFTEEQIQEYIKKNIDYDTGENESGDNDQST